MYAHVAINDQSYDANYDKLFKDKRKSKKLIYEKAQAMTMEIVLPYLSYFILFYRTLFKESAAVSDSMEATETEHFTQWAGNNVDPNIQTFTGKGTFHGIGIISIRSNSNSNFKTISSRQQKSVTNLTDCGVIVEPYYGDSYRGLHKL